MTFRSPASRCGLAPATATFPLPCPRLGLFGRCAHGLPHAQKQRLYLHRVVHIVVAALNFVHDCGRWAPRHLLWREPNASQKACFGRVRSFVVACFSRKEEFPLPPGRSGPDLVARLLELETFAGAFGLVGSSCTSDLLANFGPVPGVPPSAELPQLQPYRSLDVSRLRLHGTGSWHIAPFLEGSLWLPFQEPNILRHGLPLGTEDLPDFEKEDAEEHLKLALLWDARGLLQLVPPLPAGEAFQRSCRIFNSYKSPEADRQIGDRRPANKAELHLSVAVSRARADCNRLPFAYPVEGSPAKDVLGSTLFQAAHYLAKAAVSPLRRLGLLCHVPTVFNVKLAQEFCLASALLPLFASNIAVHQHSRAFATDASLALGAFCETEVGEELAHSLWLNGDRSPHYAIEDPDFFAWLYAVLKEGRVLALVLHPPVGPVSVCCGPEAECDFFGHLPLGLVEAAADSFAAAGREQARGQEKPKPALESVLANDLLAAGAWRVRRVLKWKGAHHINVLELSSLAVLLRELALEAPDSRISILLDSAVAKAAAAKGRSTSFALAPGLARACALQLAYGLYMSPLRPTKLFCRERSWSRLVFFLLAARPLVGSSTFAYTTALLRLPPYLQPTLDFLPRPFLDFPV
ncbi:hypothetical protein AK812_SmicGene20 [Symbiodinium microadriaticum]|uniref:Uncharacterized protein n=1 Tax=Symbiodinium microadriaticum TaxID=2951 RepID=A0A1Q9F7D7_SYMMI|nr:hypothetical protein AK812_SmicGene20 [Symbiodinium microadriaticum]